MHFIINETAGHGTAAGVWAAVERCAKSKGLEYTAQKTLYAGHAVGLAREAAASGDSGAVYALGGDGTVREVASGMVGAKRALGIIPAGTGNDIIKALLLPKDPVEAFKWSLSATARAIDVASVNGEIGLNVIGTGFDIEALQWTERFKKRLKGLLPYLLGVIFSIINHKDIEVKLRVDGGCESSEKALLIAAANGKCFGGGMMIGPEAIIDDGFFDVTIVSGCPKWRIPLLLPKFIKGDLKSIPYARVFRCKSLSIEGEGLIMDIDGELFKMGKAEISILEKALMVLG